MPSTTRVMIIVAIAGFVGTWAFLTCTTTSECLYLTIPAVALPAYLTGIEDFRRTIAARIRPADWHSGCAMTSVCPEASIDRLRAPVPLLHSRGDPLIPSEHSIRLYERACEPKRIHIFDLPDHCDAFFAEREKYRQEVVEFMSSDRKASRGR